MTGIPFILTCAILFFVLSIIGYKGMKRVRTYESIWGFMYIYGSLAWLCCILVAIIKLIIKLFTS